MNHAQSTAVAVAAPQDVLGHHEHPPYLAHHFDTVKQQTDAGKLAMWVFLATEILMFGGLFCAYAIWRANHYEAFWIGHGYLNTWWGALNTIILLASSFTMAWAVRTSQLNKRGATVVLLLLTFLGGVGFMCIKVVEYKAKYDHGMMPGRFYHPVMHRAPEHAADPAAVAVTAAAAADTKGVQPKVSATGTTLVENPRKSMRRVRGSQNHTAEELALARPFFSIYFALTGLHGLHVLIGMVLIGWVAMRAYRGDFNAEFNAPVDIVGLYWHLVDLIWIFLFPLLYLI